MYFLWGWSGQNTVWSTQRWILTIFKTSRLSCRIYSACSPREKSNNSSDSADLLRYPYACQETHLLKSNPSGRAKMALLCAELSLTSAAPRFNLVMVDEASCQELSSVMIITAGGSRRRFRWEMVQAQELSRGIPSGEWRRHEEISAAADCRQHYLNNASKVEVIRSDISATLEQRYHVDILKWTRQRLRLAALRCPHGWQSMIKCPLQWPNMQEHVVKCLLDDAGCPTCWERTIKRP